MLAPLRTKTEVILSLGMSRVINPGSMKAGIV
jgi:hypothetical protein